jgi:hypothetical protein
MSAARDAFAVGTIGSDIYVFGSYDIDGEEQASVFEFNTEVDEWSTACHVYPLATARVC